MTIGQAGVGTLRPAPVAGSLPCHRHGSRTSTVVPAPSVLSTATWPPCARTTACTAARPRPEPGVYAFVVDGTVAYVGLTTNGLQPRLDQYRRGHARQRTNARVNKLIGETLSSGKQVKILVATPQPLEWNGLP